MYTYTVSVRAKKCHVVLRVRCPSELSLAAGAAKVVS